MFKHFRRITSSGNYVAEIDGVRFVAIAMVMVQHLHERVMRSVGDQYPNIPGSNLEAILLSGGLGVSIFFALSGYVLYGILKNSKSGLEKYYLRRLTRLEPPYILISTLIFLALALGLYHGSGKFLGRGDIPLWESYLATITYTHGFLFGAPPSVNPPGWSLEVEVQFYVLAPLLVAAMLWCRTWRTRVAVLVAVIVPWIFFIAPLAAPHPHIQNSLLHWFPYFLVGFAIYEVVNRGPRDGKSSRGILDLVAVGALLALPVVSGGLIAMPELGRSLFICLFIGLFLWGALAGSWLRRLLQIGWVANIGGMCYTIYLIHVPCIELLARITTHLKAPIPYIPYLLLQAILVFPFVLAVASVFFLLIERPCMNKNWPQDLWSFVKRKTAQPVSSWIPLSKESVPASLEKSS